MKNTQLLLLAMFCYTTMHTNLAMEKEVMPVTSFHEQSAKLFRQYRNQNINHTNFTKEIDDLCKKAIVSGISPSTPMNLYNIKHDILGYALTNKNESLVQCCFEQGYSPNNPVLYDGKKVPALKIAPAQFWPLFKKHKANFNIIVKNSYETPLHRSMWNDENEIKWLIEEAQLDINQPDGYGNTAAHILAEKFYIGGECNEAQFNILAKNTFNPFQKNNENKTPKEIAQKHEDWYKNKLMIEPSDQNLQEFHPNSLKMVYLLKDYERKYLENNKQKDIQKHCYCETFAHSNKRKFSVESENFTPKQIVDAYNFFPQDSLIGSFCKQNTTNSNCITIAKHYICFNNVYHACQKKYNNWNQCRKLEEKEKEICLQHNIATELMHTTPFQETIALLDTETKEQYEKIDQLPIEEQIALEKKLEQIQEDKFGITPLIDQLHSIREQLQQLQNEKVLKQEKKERKKIQGYYSALDFDVCLGKSDYHQAVKNLLAMFTTYELKTIEALKINEGLHNAFHNKKTLKNH